MELLIVHNIINKQYFATKLLDFKSKTKNF